MIFQLTRTSILSTILLFAIGAAISNVSVAEEQSVNTSPNSNQTTEVLDKSLDDIAEQKKSINYLQTEIGKTTGITQQALESRLDKAWLKLLEQNLAFAKSVVAEDKANAKFDKYRNKAIEILGSQADVATKAINRIRSRVKIPDSSQSAAEQAAANTRLYEHLDSIIHAYELLSQSLELAEQFKIDVSTQKSAFKEKLSERAAIGSVLLEMAMNEVTALRASVSAVPDDAELKAKLNVATNYVRSLAARLTDVVAMMDKLEMDTAAYHEQLLSATGEITTEVFEVSVVTNLLVGWGQTLWAKIIDDGPNLLFKIFLFIIIVFGFRKLADFVKNVVERALEKSHLQLSELLRRMVVSIVRNLIIILGILIALSQIGISLGPLLAGLGVAGFVIGFALQDSLSNFAAGMMILIYRPFDVGDLIEAGGVSGKVSKMSLVNTTILTLDNQTIVVPNNKIWGDVVRNVTAQTMRRIDMMFGISYSDDIPKTESVLQAIVDSHEKVLADPEPVVRLHELADSSVNFVVRPWVKKEDYCSGRRCCRSHCFRPADCACHARSHSGYSCHGWPRS